MRGSTNYQIQQIFRQSDICAIGQSKHLAKEVAREAGARTWAEMGRNLKIHSYGTADAYRAVWRHVLDHAKAEFQMKDVERLNGDHVRSYLQSKIEQGVAKATFQQYAAACGKLEQALQSYSDRHDRNNSYDFRPGIQDARIEARQEGLRAFEGSRAYADPAALVSAVTNRDHQIAAAIQHEGGPRIDGVGLIRAEQLQGYRIDPISGQEKGHIEIQGKGGKITEHAVSRQTYQRLESAIKAGDGRFRIDKDAYRDALKHAAQATGQEYTGSHGLRWSFAQERCAEIQERGGSYEQALAQVSQELGHERADITEHYLR